MEAMQHGHLLHVTGVIHGDDEMMDSEYDQTVQPDDDYDIDLDGTEAYSNAGDEEMKFDVGEDAVSYDNDDLMLDEGEYQATTAQVEMITEQPVNEPFSSIQMATGLTAEGDPTQSIHSDSHVDLTPLPNQLPDTQSLSQIGTQDLHSDSFIMSQNVPDVVVEVPNSPAINKRVPDVQQHTNEALENTQQEEPVEAQEDVVHSSHDVPTEQVFAQLPSNEVAQLKQTVQDGNSNTESAVHSDNILTLEKIHPIIVQFETNTLALFNSENYLNFAALDTAESTYPEIPSVFLLQDISFFSKGFDELFAALREMFGATIGDDAEIAMEVEDLELFLHEDNLLSKSISLSDLMNLYLRLSKQDGAERPDPLYIMLSTQPRFTKRYSELLTAAGEGKGLSQVRTYGSENDYPTINDDTSLVQDTQREHVENNNAPAAQSLAATKIDVEPSSNDSMTSKSSPYSSHQGTVSPHGDERPKAAEEGKHIEVTRDDYHDIEQKSTEQKDAEEGVPNTQGGDAEVKEEGKIGDSVISSVPDNSQINHSTAEQQAERCIDGNLTTARENIVRQLDAEEDVKEVVAESESARNTGKHYKVEEVVDSVTIGTVADSDPSENSPDNEPVGSLCEHEQETHVRDKGVEGKGSPESTEISNEDVHAAAGARTLATTEELQEYEEEDEGSSPFSEIPAEDGTAQPDTGVLDDTGDDAQTQFDDESFSSATIVGVSDAHSPCEYEASPGLGTTGAESPQVDVEQHQIQVYQYDENSPDYGNTERETHLEADNLEAYEYEEAEEIWEGESGEFLQDESYYTAVLEQEGYTDAEYGDKAGAAYGLREEVSSGANYDDHGYNKKGEQISDDPYDDGLYEEYPEELAEEGVLREAKSPNGKRFREEEGDVLDIQDTKRTRSS